MKLSAAALSGLSIAAARQVLSTAVSAEESANEVTTSSNAPPVGSTPAERRSRRYTKTLKQHGQSVAPKSHGHPRHVREQGTKQPKKTKSHDDDIVLLCSTYEGAARGLCVAYCEKKNKCLDVALTSASPQQRQSCHSLKFNFQKITGLEVLPCEEAATSAAPSMSGNTVTPSSPSVPPSVAPTSDQPSRTPSLLPSSAPSEIDEVSPNCENAQVFFGESASNRLGWAVAMSNGYAVAGAARIGRSGAAYVYALDADLAGWSFQAELINPTPSALVTSAFGQAVAIDSATIFVGDYTDFRTGLNQGKAVVFERYDCEDPSSLWNTTVTELYASDASAYGQFGFAVAVSGDVAVIGASSAGAEFAGAAYVFRRLAPGVWEEEQILTPTSTVLQSNALFGSSVAIDDNVIVVGSSLVAGTYSLEGAAFVFEYNAVVDSWEERQKLTASDPQSSLKFGTSLVVGTLFGQFTDDAGKAYVFSRKEANGTWVETTILQEGDLSSGFGRAVDIDDAEENLVVGALFDDDFRGAVYWYHRNHTAGPNKDWILQNTTIRGTQNSEDSSGYEDEAFGSAVAISPNGLNFMVGARKDDQVESNGGATYLYTSCQRQRS
eukprot:CAMPEP_0172474734 /NCGR_PEP_ID=MMETSP1065-20121228/69510_1 /TAXON_ID=265537 /ORGANISM="Amphiprora paludosa, Strain CCMP125" /LENGTH=607 /DNA_ID=CAMNT_0013232923 /DNA_START=882 /DNA_END=2705 /DNA_ORIENTATION=-